MTPFNSDDAVQNEIESAEYPHDATLEFVYETAGRARTIARSVGREIGEIDDDRSRTTLDLEDRAVTVAIYARDLTALRAACNTWLTLIDVAERAVLLGEAVGETSRSNGELR